MGRTLLSYCAVLPWRTLRSIFAPFAVKGLTSPESFKILDRKVRQERPLRTLKVLNQETPDPHMALVAGSAQVFLQRDFKVHQLVPFGVAYAGEVEVRAGQRHGHARNIEEHESRL